MANELAKATAAEIERTVQSLGAVPGGVPEHIDDVPTARMLPFANRYTAGRTLGRVLAQYTRTHAVVLGMASGGLAVASGVGEELELPIDAWFTRKLRAPQLPALSIGVVAEGWALVLDREAVARADLMTDQIRTLAHEAASAISAEAKRYRGGRQPIDLRGKTAILCDDGIVMGGTLSAAAEGVRRRGATKVVVAAPVASRETLVELQRDVDEVFCLVTPKRLRRVGAWYTDYRNVTENSIVKILGRGTVAA